MMQYDDASDPILPYLIAPTLDSSIGVFTHQNGDYSLIQMAAGVINAAGISLTEGGTSLKQSYTSTYETPSTRSTAIGGSNEQNKHEAYILGQARTISSFIQIGSYTTAGAPLAYGWNFNWNGSEAICVTHEAIFSESKLDHYLSHTYVVTIIEDDDGLLSASVAEIESRIWEPVLAETFIWKPTIDGVTIVELWYPYGCGSNQIVAGYGESECQANVYAYYKADGERVIIEYIRGEKDTTTVLADLVQESYEVLCPDYGFYDTGPGVLSGEYKGHLGKQEFGFIVNGEETLTFNTDGGLYRKTILTRTLEEQCTNTTSTITQTLLLIATDYDWPSPDYSCTYPSSPSGCSHEIKGHYFHCETWEGSSEDYPTVGKVALVLPVHSCETAYVSTLESSNPSLRHIIKEGEGLGEIRRVGSTFSPNPGVPSSPWVGFNSPLTTASINCKLGVPTLVYGYGYGCWSQPPQRTLSEDVSPDLWDINLYLHTGFEDINIESFETDDYNSLGGYTQLFYPTLCLEIPYFGSLLNIGSAFGNSIRMESIKDRELGSNCAVDAALMLPYGGLWVGRV